VSTALTHAPPHTRTHTRARTHAPPHSHTHTRTRTHAPPHTRTHPPHTRTTAHTHAHSGRVVPTGVPSYLSSEDVADSDGADVLTYLLKFHSLVVNENGHNEAVRVVSTRAPCQEGTISDESELCVCVCVCVCVRSCLP
jgi:hypothetical protein